MAALLASAATAEEKSSAADLAAARAHARQGLKLYDLGRYADAVNELELAYRRKAVPALLFNIAQCHRQLGHLDEAVRFYRAFLRSNPPARLADQAHELLAAAEEDLSRQSQARAPPPAELPPTHPAPAPAAAASESAGPAVPPPASVPAEAIAATPSLPIAVEEHRNWPWLTAGGVAAAALAGGVVEALASRSATNRLAQLHRETLLLDASTDVSLRNDAAAKYSRAKALYVVSAVAAAAAAGLSIAF